jgi:hypothetical protein
MLPGSARATDYSLTAGGGPRILLHHKGADAAGALHADVVFLGVLMLNAEMGVYFTQGVDFLALDLGIGARAPIPGPLDVEAALVGGVYKVKQDRYGTADLTPFVLSLEGAATLTFSWFHMRLGYKHNLVASTPRAKEALGGQILLSVGFLI